MEDTTHSAIAVLHRPAVQRLEPPTLEATDRQFASITGEMDAALVRLHADFDQILADQDAAFTEARRILDRGFPLPERRRGFWARLWGLAAAFTWWAVPA